MRRAGWGCAFGERQRIAEACDTSAAISILAAHLQPTRFMPSTSPLLLRIGASGLVNGFVVKPTADSASWYSWNTTYNLMDAASGLFQQVLFTAPVGTQLSQGENFNLDVNFSGVITTDSGWAASWDDRLAPLNVVPEPGSLALLGLGLAGILVSRRKYS